MFFNTKNSSIYYEKYGSSDKVILILPGWGNTSPTFSHIINYFKDDYTIYILDYPGFGNSPLPNKTLSIYDYTNIIRDFMQEEKIFNPTIIAHSFGGRIATLLAGYYKEHIDKLVLIDIAPIKPKKTFFKFLKEKTYKLLKKIIRIFPKKYQETFSNKLFKLFASSDYNLLPPIMQNTFKNIVNTDLTYYLKYIDSEALIIWGKLDKETPLSNAYKINNLIKDSALIIFPNSAHFPYLDNPFLINKILTEFLKS